METKYLTEGAVKKVIEELPLEGDYRDIAKFVCKLAEEPETGYMVKLGSMGKQILRGLLRSSHGPTAKKRAS